MTLTRSEEWRIGAYWDESVGDEVPINIIDTYGDGIETNVWVRFTSVSLYNSKFVELTVERNDEIPIIFPVAMNIQEVAADDHEIAIEDYTFSYVIIESPYEYTFTTGDWVITQPWADLDFVWQDLGF